MGWCVIHLRQLTLVVRGIDEYMIYRINLLNARTERDGQYTRDSEPFRSIDGWTAEQLCRYRIHQLHVSLSRHNTLFRGHRNVPDQAALVVLSMVFRRLLG